MPSMLVMVVAALQDCLSPAYVVPAAVVFFVVSRAMSRLTVLTDGLSIIAGFAMGLLFNYTGGDLALNVIPVYFFERTYILVGIIFLVLGLVFLTDWLKCFRPGRSKLIIQLFKFSNSTKNIFWVILFDVFLLGVGGIFALMCSHLLIPHRYVFFAANEMLMPGNTIHAVTHLVIYTLTFVFPLVLGVVVLVNALGNDRHCIEFFQLSIARILCAALYCGLGISLIYLYL